MFPPRRTRSRLAGTPRDHHVTAWHVPSAFRGGVHDRVGRTKGNQKGGSEGYQGPNHVPSSYPPQRHIGAHLCGARALTTCHLHIHHNPTHSLRLACLRHIGAHLYFMYIPPDDDTRRQRYVQQYRSLTSQHAAPTPRWLYSVWYGPNTHLRLQCGVVMVPVAIVVQPSHPLTLWTIVRCR